MTKNLIETVNVLSNTKDVSELRKFTVMNFEALKRISAEFWVRLQADYELTLVRLAYRNEEILA